MEVESSPPISTQSTVNQQSGPEATTNCDNYAMDIDSLDPYHRLAVLLPPSQSLKSMKAEILRKCEGVAIQTIRLGKASCGRPAMILEVATKGQLVILKRTLPDWKNVMLQQKTEKQDGTSVILINKRKYLPEKKDFKAAALEFGNIKTVEGLAPLNVKITFSLPEEAAACLSAGALYVKGKRFLCVPWGTRFSLKDKPSAWLHGLPTFTQDYHLEGLIPGAIDWMVMVTPGLRNNQPCVFAKVVFKDVDALGTVVNSAMLFQGRRLTWETEVKCTICNSSDHQALMCEKRGSKTVRFGGSPRVSDTSYSQAAHVPNGKVSTVLQLTTPRSAASAPAGHSEGEGAIKPPPTVGDVFQLGKLLAAFIQESNRKFEQVADLIKQNQQIIELLLKERQPNKASELEAKKADQNKKPKKKSSVIFSDEEDDFEHVLSNFADSPEAIRLERQSAIKARSRLRMATLKSDLLKAQKVAADLERKAILEHERLIAAGIDLEEGEIETEDGEIFDNDFMEIEDGAERH